MSRRSQLEALKEVNLLEMAPVRAASWEEVEDRVLIERRRPKKGQKRFLHQWLRYWLATKRLQLDDKGTFVWLHLDGKRTVAEVASELRKKYGDGAEPAEERTGEMIRLLHREDFLLYPGWDEIDQEIGHSSEIA